MTIPAQDRQHRSRHRAAHRSRHRAATANESFSRGFKALGELALAGVQVSARAADLATGQVLFSVDDHVVMPTSSIGQVLLLIEVAARIERKDPGGLELLDRAPDDTAGESGLWRYLQVPALPVDDLAALIGATSDDVATNVLLRRIGLDAVSARSESLGLTRTALLDLVRDHRGPDDAPQLSVGSARELTWLFGALARGDVVSEEVSRRVLSWLSLNSDLSMVAAAFGLDPHAHQTVDHGVHLINKTGTDTGVRSDAGVLRGPRSSVTYAVSTYFDDHRIATRLAVLEGMRTVGLDLLEYVH